MKYLMKSGTRPTVGSTAERNANHRYLRTRPLSEPARHLDLNLEPLILSAAVTERWPFLRSTPPLVWRDLRSQATIVRFGIGSGGGEIYGFLDALFGSQILGRRLLTYTNTAQRVLRNGQTFVDVRIPALPNLEAIAG